MKSQTKRYYVVWEGREKGVFTDWGYVKALVSGYEGARYRGYMSKEEAEKAYEEGYDVGKKRVEKKLFAERPIVRAIAVDAACSGNPGEMEYRGVSLWDRKVIFHQKYGLGTNNIGEFLAIVHGLALLKGRDDVVIYSDSEVAIGWVKGGRCRTKLDLTPMTAEVFDVIKRAEKWLKENKYGNKIIKWETELWGEIPADFGRK